MKAIEISYTISFPQPHDHYTKVVLQIINVNREEIVLKMPTWTPGSYLIREFSRQVERENASNTNGKFLAWKKTDKNTWVIKTSGEKSMVFEYWVYCFELSVRTNFVDESHAFLNGGSTFMYVEGEENYPYQIKIEKPKNWKQLSTALPMVKNNPLVRIAANYDELVDSPIEIGNHEIWEFEARGIPHQVAVYGESNCNKEVFLQDLKKIAEAATVLMGENPCSNYLFIIHHTDNKWGGLEHLHSTVCHVPRWDYTPKDKYQKTMGLLSHEYFHLWNGKRIRPIELGPFNYEAENYSRQLWVVEGLTTYYDDYILYKAGLLTCGEYLQVLTILFTQVVNHPGNDVQSLTESSFDTWIKFYRQHENSSNNQVSYYRKGACIAIALNMLIMEATKGEKSLDDVMRLLYKSYLANPETGYTEVYILNALKEVSGIDFEEFIQKQVEGTETLDYAELFLKVGLELKSKNAETAATQKELGWTTRWKDGKLLVSSLDKNYGAYYSGINTDDELISIDGYRVMEGFEKIYESKKVGETIEITLSRQGLMHTVTVTLTCNNKVEYTLTPLAKPDKEQKKLLKVWL